MPRRAAKQHLDSPFDVDNDAPNRSDCSQGAKKKNPLSKFECRRSAKNHSFYRDRASVASLGLTPRTARGRKISFRRETVHKQSHRIASHPVYESLHRVGCRERKGNEEMRASVLSRILKTNETRGPSGHAGNSLAEQKLRELVLGCVQKSALLKALFIYCL